MFPSCFQWQNCPHLSQKFCILLRLPSHGQRSIYRNRHVVSAENDVGSPSAQFLSRTFPAHCWSGWKRKGIPPRWPARESSQHFTMPPIVFVGAGEMQKREIFQILDLQRGLHPMQRLCIGASKKTRDEYWKKEYGHSGRLWKKFLPE